MTQDGQRSDPPQQPRYRAWWRSTGLPRWVGPTALLLVSGFFIAVVFWGFFNPLEIRVEYFDAGSVNDFAIGEVKAYPSRDLYVIGMQDGRLRAIDTRIDTGDGSEECVAQYQPDDDRGRLDNPRGVDGVFEDPCSGAIWSIEGNAIRGSDQPLRTPHIEYHSNEDGSLHAFVELVNP